MSEARVTISLAPTWAGVMPALVAALLDGTAKGQKIAEEELSRMSRILDDLGDRLTRARQYDEALAKAGKLPTGNDYDHVVHIVGIRTPIQAIEGASGAAAARDTGTEGGE